jgi:hypothetical protein
MFTPQPLCYFFMPNDNGIASQNMDMSNIGHPIAFPPFFFPN